MSNSSNWNMCQIVCCAIAAGIGLVVFLVTMDEISFLGALLVGVVLGVILYVALSRLACTGHSAAQPAPAQDPAPATTTSEPEPEPEEPAPTPAPAQPEAQTDASPVRTGTLLSGEQVLAARKREWTYSAAPAEPAAPAAAQGSQPQGLSAARDGGADDLKQIKGVGPKSEQLLNTMGFYHFDQIAGWGADEVAWVDDNLKGFKGRVSRDNWVEQARTLAAGGETEFSKRVEDGDVY